MQDSPDESVPELVQLLTPEGELVEHPEYAVTFTDDELRGLYRDLVLVRRIDAEATALQRQGELGIWASLLGQEAAQIGSGRALRSADHVFPTYREHGVAWCRGRRPAEPARPVPRRRHGRLGPGRAQVPPLHDRHRRADPARDRLRDGHPARRRGRGGRRGRRRVLRRRGDQPGRRERGLHLGQRVPGPGRVLLPEQPVGDLGAAREAVPHPAVPARPRLRLPRRPGRRQRRPRHLRGHQGGAAARPGGQRPHLRRGVHLPDGRAHDVRRPDPLPHRRRGRGLEAQGPDRAAARLPRAQRQGGPGLLRRARGGERPARQARARRLPGHGRPGPAVDLRHVYAEPHPLVAAQKDEFAAYLASFEGGHNGGGAPHDAPPRWRRP